MRKKDMELYDFYNYIDEINYTDKYDEKSNEELREIICKSFPCNLCPIHILCVETLIPNCAQTVIELPIESRIKMIDFLRKQEKKGCKNETRCI